MTAAGMRKRPEPPAGSQTAFRSDVDLVRLDVSVLDRSGTPVRGLTAADFTVLEDGQAQTIDVCDAVDLPDQTTQSASWMRDVPPDVVTNRVAAQRVIVLILDDFHIPLDPWTVQATQRIARTVITQSGPTDLLAVVYTLSRNKGQEFTVDRNRLLTAVDRFTAFGTAAPQNTFSASERGPQSGAPPAPTPNRGPSGACLHGGCVTSALLNAAEILREWPGGRKTVVLISPGIRMGTMESVERGGQLEDLRRTFAAMQEANVNVYQFDPRGLQVTRPVEADQFEVFAENTGGRAITNTNAPWMLIPQVFRENSSYYILGFRPPSTAAGSRFRKVTVRVARPDLEVRSRSGYYAPSRSTAATRSRQPATAIDIALARGLPTGDVPLTLAVAPFANPGKRIATLAIVAGFDEPRALFGRGRVQLVATAFRDDWKPAGALTQYLEAADLGSSEQGARSDIVSRLDLPPGRYEIRVAVDNRAMNRTGSAYMSVTIPDFQKDALGLSGVVLARDTPLRADSMNPVAALIPFVPTTERAFTRDDRVTSFLRVYQGGKKPVVPVDLIVRMVNEADRVVFDQAFALGAERFVRARGTDHTFGLPLERLEPGEYLVTFEARTAGQLVRRDLRLTIR